MSSVGKPPTIAIVAALMLLAIGGYTISELSAEKPIDIRAKQRADNELLQAALERNRKSSILGECDSKKLDSFKSFDAAYTTKNYGLAASILKECAAADSGTEYSKKWSEANRLDKISVASNRKAPAKLRIAAITELSLSYPIDAEPFNSVLPTLQAQAVRDEQRVKKTQGVKLGMSPADVLASAWGKPDRKNRSISAKGTVEQWVYPDGQYLYFVNDALTRIETSVD